MFNPAAATAAYINGLGPVALEMAADYTTGNHWLQLWGLLVAAIVTIFFVRMKILDRLDTRLAARSWAFRTFLLGTAFLLLSAILTLPWDVYTGWWRETVYGRTSQPLGDYLRQSALNGVITALLGGLFFLGIYALIRRVGKQWWLWSGGLSAIAISTFLLISPIVIEPLFNDYQPVPAGPVDDALVAMAKTANIPADHIFMYDGSRQSNNFTANVSGIASSARIAISDVAMDKASLDEVKVVTGHEIGHYVLGHIWRGVFLFSGLSILFFFLADRLFVPLARRFGSDSALGDPRGFPVIVFFLSLFGLIVQPITNSFSRYDEAQADVYAMKTQNLPDALAAALVKTAEYRNPRPGRLEEIIFYSHPSVQRRVRAAMDWKATHRPGPPSKDTGYQ